MAVALIDVPTIDNSGNAGFISIDLTKIISVKALLGSRDQFIVTLSSGNSSKEKQRWNF